MENIKDKHPMLLINITSKTFKNTMRKKQEAVGIPDGFRMVLMMLSNNDGASQLDIGKMSCLSKPTVSLTLSNMEDNGLIKRITNEKDKRIINVYLTSKGKQMIDTIKSLVKETEKEFFKDFNDEEIKVLKSMLERILVNAGLE